MPWAEPAEILRQDAPQFLQAHIGVLDIRVHSQAANPFGDKVGVLAAEIKNGDFILDSM